MKKTLIFFGTALILGLGYWLISPLFTTREVNESLEDIVTTGNPIIEVSSGEKTNENNPAEVEIIGQGNFLGADSFHKASGKAKLLKIGEKYYVRFENDFSVTNGPDLFVHFGKDGRYVSEARLGELKGNAGSQNYEVPSTINPLDYNEIWIWCRAFSVPFGSAKIE